MFARRYFSHSHRVSKPLIVYTDGSFMSNLLIGGMGLYYPNNEMTSLSIKYVNETHVPTCQRCELMAVKYALIIHNAWFNDKEMHIYTDSKYTIDSLTLYGHRWQNNGWITASGKPVKNQDLLKPMVSYINMLPAQKIKLNYVPSHSNQLDTHSVNNRIADAYARRGLIMSDRPWPANFVHPLD
jgi:ribonuclease HI